MSKARPRKHKDPPKPPAPGADDYNMGLVTREPAPPRSRIRKQGNIQVPVPDGRGFPPQIRDVLDELRREADILAIDTHEHHLQKVRPGQAKWFCLVYDKGKRPHLVSIERRAEMADWHVIEFPALGGQTIVVVHGTKYVGKGKKRRVVGTDWSVVGVQHGGVALLAAMEQQERTPAGS